MGGKSSSDVALMDGLKIPIYGWNNSSEADYIAGLIKTRLNRALASLAQLKLVPH